MHMGGEVLRDTRPIGLQVPGSVTSRGQVTPSEPESVVGKTRSWKGVSLCEMELRWTGGKACHEITQDGPTLWIIAEQIGGQYEHRVRPGEPAQRGNVGQHAMSLVPAGTTLWGHASSIRFVRCFKLTFDKEAIGAALAERDIEAAFAAPRLMFSHEPLWQLASLLAAECSKPAGCSGLYGDSLAIALCIEVLRLAETDTRTVARGGLAPWQMRRVTEYMEAHLCETIQLSDFARLTGMSRSHFSQAFRRSTGMPPHQWHLSERIRRAQELLLDNRITLADIAYQTGFADQSHFTKIFQRQIGTSPGVWRREHRN